MPSRYHRDVTTPRIAVVGAGIVGCSVAFELARRAADVVLLDRSELSGGATQASAGILAPYTEAHAGGRLFDLTVRGLAAYDAFVADVRTVSPEVFEYRRSGTIEVAENEERLHALTRRLAEPWAGAAGLEWLDRLALQREAPSITAGALGGLRCPQHAHVAVRAFVRAIEDAARRLGVRVDRHARVERIALDGRSASVWWGGEAHAFDRVVLAAGAWAPALDPVGQLTGRIAPVRGQLVKLRADRGAFRPVLWSGSCYLVPWEDGTVLVGATSEDAGFEVAATAEGVRDLLQAATALVPALSRARFESVLVGLRPGTEDGVPIIGPSRDPRVIYAAGHFRNGVLLAPLTARLLADSIFTNATDPAFSTT